MALRFNAQAKCVFGALGQIAVSFYVFGTNTETDNRGTNNTDIDLRLKHALYVDDFVVFFWSVQHPGVFEDGS
eukprot:9502194-Pyramimonas_sp.AAC.1